jgi:calcineurin-like phosphoesterase
MTGPAQSVLGINPEQAVNRFLGGLPRRFEAAQGPSKLESVLFTIDTGSKQCVSVKRIDIQG